MTKTPETPKKPYVAVVDAGKNAIVARFWHEDGKLRCDNDHYLTEVKSDRDRAHSTSDPAILKDILLMYRSGYLHAYKVSDHE
jgi:hypothetical protein